MQEQNSAGATGKADNLDNATANKPANLNTDGADGNYPNKANESGGAGSPYGGTQSADGKAPDGNQQINKGASGEKDGSALPEGAGDEFESPSSYGDEGDDKAGDNNGGDDARGSSVS